MPCQERGCLLGSQSAAVLELGGERGPAQGSLGHGGDAADLQTRPWGASDGQVIDRYGLRWLIEGDESA
jgi:hypothetical protein